MSDELNKNIENLELANQNKVVTEDSEIEPNPALMNPLPKNEIKNLFSALEITALQQKQSKQGLDLATLTEKQIDKVLSIMEKNEDNAFEYHKIKINASKTIEEKRIDASIFRHKTFRIIAIVLILFLAILLTIVLLFKDEFFITLILVIASASGGGGLTLGISKMVQNTKPIPYENNLPEKEK